MDEGKQVGGVWLPTNDIHLSDNIQNSPKSKWRDGKLTYQINKLDKAMSIQPSYRRRTCIDIGANVGLWTMWLANEFEAVSAFEPLQDLHETVFWKNVTQENVVFHPYALGHEKNLVEMIPPNGHGCNAYISDDSLLIKDFGDTAGQDIYMVQMLPLDYFEFEEVDFIKIDTQGFELFILQGAEKTIRRWLPNIVLEQADLEVHYGHKKKEALHLLESWGMQCEAVMGPDHIMVWG